MGEHRIKKKEIFLRKKSREREIDLSDVRNYYQILEMIAMWNWYLEKQMDQWNMMERPEVNPRA